MKAKVEEINEELYLDPVFADFGMEVYTYEFAEKLRAYNLEMKTHNRRIWNAIPQAGFQENVLLCDANIQIIGGKRGGGKATSVDSLIVTPFGYRRLGDLKVGDIITDPTTGGMERVIDIFEHPDHDLYEVTFDDGCTCECGLEHLWNVRQTGYTHKRRHLYGGSVEDDYRTWTFGMIKRWLDEQAEGKYIDRKSKSTSKKHLVIPLSEPVKFTVSTYPMRHKPDIDPYVIGALIGDGSLSSTVGVALTSDDSFIVGEFEKAGIDMSHKAKKQGTTAFSYRIPNDQIFPALQQLKLLDTHSEDKFIPYCYKWGTIEERWAVVQGLMDTDGYVDKRGHCSFTTVSKQLAEDFQFIIRSLGGSATLTVDTNTGYKKDGEFVKCADAYTVTIKIKDTSKLFRLPRKRERCASFNGGVSEVARRIVSYRYIGKKDARCIMVDSPRSLYMLQDFIVTHNSHIALMGGLPYAMEPGARMYAFRKYKEDVENSIWKTSKDVFKGFGTPTKSNYTWTFPSGSQFTMTHISDAGAIKDRFRGVEGVYIDIEELAEHTESDLNVLRDLCAMNRSTSGMHPILRATCNPVGKENALRTLIEWWIDPETDEVIHERSGVIRYLYWYGKGPDEIVFGDTKEEVYNDPRVKPVIDAVCDATGETYDKFITSFTFIEGEYRDNKILQATDKDYLGKLAMSGSANLINDTVGKWRTVDTGDSVISRADMDRFFENAERRDGHMRATCDVALAGDFLVLWAFDGHHICDLEMRRGGLSDDVIPFILGFLEKNGVRRENFTYDENGLGLWLRESRDFKDRAVGFNNKSAPSNNKLWNNLKSECAEKFTQAIKNGEFSIDSSILDRMSTDQKKRTMSVRDRLMEERRALKRKENVPRYEIIDKKDMVNLIGHSPDFIEGLFMVMHLMEKKKEIVRKGFGFLF